MTSAVWSDAHLYLLVFCSVLDACLILLEETNTDIRKFATHFVGSLQWDKKAPRVCCISLKYSLDNILLT